MANASNFAPTLAGEASLQELGSRLLQAGYRFVTPTPLTIGRVNSREKNRHAQNLTDIFGWNRLFDAALLPSGLLANLLDSKVVEQTADGLRSMVRVSSIGQNLYFHSAYPTTQNDCVFFGPDTYRFVRQLHLFLSTCSKKPRRCVDIGCGSGAGAIELALAFPKAAVHALDINPVAISMTCINAALAGTNNLAAAESNLLCDIDGEFDLIIANPPFLVDGESRAYRHGGGEMGAGLTLAIIESSIERLAPGGSMLLYSASAIINGVDRLRESAVSMLEMSGMEWSYEEIDPDIFGEELEQAAYEEVERIAAIWLMARKPLGWPVAGS